MWRCFYAASADLVLRAQGGVGVPVGCCGVLWRSYGRVLKSAAVMGQVRVLFADYCLTYDFC